ncbi:putative uncharacterized protein [Acidiphilium sp. CAG:727]|nr:putative uncharacterized protein [Acidiphilium sp. CAG:727]
MIWYYILSYASLIIIVPGVIFAFVAQLLVRSAYKKYSKVEARSGWTADDMSRMFMERYDCNGVTVEPIKGDLTDNYNPSTDVISLSETVYGKSTIAALGVAAHECGHARQQHEGSFMMALRKVLVPATNIGSNLAVPLVILGLLLEFWLGTVVGTYFWVAGVVLYSLSTIFALVTLPVEIGASSRAMKMLEEQNVLEKDERRGARKVLSAAALTYVAALLVSLLYLLRFLIIIAGTRRKKR